MRTILAAFLFVPLLASSQDLNLFPDPFQDDRVQCFAYTEIVTPEQQGVINQVMAQHQHRLFHFLWHTTRSAWGSLTTEEQWAIQNLNPQWGRSAPLCPRPGREFLSYNPAGEEFLRMHHEMIVSLRQALVMNGLPCIASWKDIPEANDPLWPVPQGLPGDSSKSQTVGHLIHVWSETFKDPSFLRGRSLSEVGYLIEFSIHNNMHMRWASIPQAGDDFSPLQGGIFTVHNMTEASAFDLPDFNWLGNPYSSQVNPIFWKLHGWIDDVIKGWLHANSYLYISDRCTGNYCYNWQSRWMSHSNMSEPTGGSGHHHGAHQGSAADANNALSKLAPFSSFRNTKLDDFLSEPRGGSGMHGIDPLEDPELYVDQFGPCSGQ